MIALEFIKRIESGDIIEKDELLIFLTKLEDEVESCLTNLMQEIIQNLMV